MSFVCTYDVVSKDQASIEWATLPFNFRSHSFSEKGNLDQDSDSIVVDCHGRVGSFIFILSCLRTCDPGRILPYIDRGMFIF